MSEENPTQNSDATPAPKSFVPRTVSAGDMVTGTVVKIAGSVAFIDYGARNEGYIELGELRDADGNVTVEVGSEVEAEVLETRGAVRLSARKAQAKAARGELRTAFEAKRPVRGRVAGINKGGFEVRIEGARAFCPRSQIAERPPADPARLVGQELDFIITEYPEKKSLVVSHRSYLDQQRDAARSTLGTRFRKGDRLQGKVTQLQTFGAFVEISPGVEGLVHVSEISHTRIDHPNQRLQVGEAVEVQVKSVDIERGRVSLSMKSLESDPVTEFLDGLEVGATMTGTVAVLQDFGAFVNLHPGVDGLLHVSAISAEKRINHPSEAVSEGQKVEVIIEKIDRVKRKIGLMTPEVAASRVPVEINFKKGDVLKGKVTRVEQYGVFIELSEGVVGLCPNGEMATDRGTDHRRMFPIGTELEVKVVEIERARNRIRLSRKAMLNHDENTAFADYKKQQNETGSGGMGTLGDLFADLLKK